MKDTLGINSPPPEDNSGGGLLLPGYLSPSSHCVGIDTSGGGLLFPGYLPPSGLIDHHLRYQCRRTDYWAEDNLGTNSSSPEVSMPTHWTIIPGGIFRPVVGASALIPQMEDY
jgi:hypothetical protein